MLPYQSNELIHITTSPAQQIECEGLTVCNGYCITVETKNSIYKLQNVSKSNYFRILEQTENKVCVDCGKHMNTENTCEVDLDLNVDTGVIETIYVCSECYFENYV